MATWVLYRDACGHFAVGLEGQQAFAAVEHEGSFYSKFVRTFEKRRDANADRVLDEEASYEEELSEEGDES